MTQETLFSRVEEIDVTARAVSQAFSELAARHAKEYGEILKAKLKACELEASAPVTDADGKELLPETKVLTPDRKTATIVRVDRRSRRVVVEYADGGRQMLTASRLTTKPPAKRRAVAAA